MADATDDRRPDGGGSEAEFAERLRRMTAGLPGLWAAGAQGAQDASRAAVGAMGERARNVRFDPARMLEAQMRLWQDYQRLWMDTTARLLRQNRGGSGGGAAAAPPAAASADAVADAVAAAFDAIADTAAAGTAGGPAAGADAASGPASAPAPVAEPAPEDRRFDDEEWTRNPVFDYIKQAYLLNAAWARRMVESVEGLDDDTAQKVDFFSRQIVDAMAPTNFALTNPAVLRETAQSRGANLRKGYENLAADLARGGGALAVDQVDRGAFEVGGNIAVTPGEVVFQNDLLQLIQYAPATDTVYRRPLLIVPPWINKFYILDLRRSNSFVAWCVERGYTVFMVSWVNPDERHRDLTFDDYLRDGVFAALAAVERATGEKEVNAIGYCIGGTLLAMALAWLGAGARREDAGAGAGADADGDAAGGRRIAAATFFASQVDFREGGELRVFTDPATLRLIEGEVERKGYLDGASMAAAFNMLRSNELVWYFAINNYLMGKPPPAFDLLYWNDDATRFPARLLFDYLRGMYQENRLAVPGGFEALGRRLDLADVRIPVYVQAARQDHIAPAVSVFKAMDLFGGGQGGKRFVLAGSGHIAGVVNPPDRNKYQHWTNARRKRYGSVDEWLADAVEHPGSWWPDWDRWMSRRSGGRVAAAARAPGGGALRPIEPAPGSYVKVRCDGAGAGAGVNAGNAA